MRHAQRTDSSGTNHNTLIRPTMYCDYQHIIHNIPPPFPPVGLTPTQPSHYQHHMHPQVLLIDLLSCHYMTCSFVLSRIAHPGGLTAPYQQHNQALQPHPKMSSIIPHVTPTKDNAASPSRELRFSPHTHPSVFDLFSSLPDTGPSGIPTLSHIFHTIDGFVQDTAMPYKKCQQSPLPATSIKFPSRLDPLVQYTFVNVDSNQISLYLAATVLADAILAFLGEVVGHVHPAVVSCAAQRPTPLETGRPISLPDMFRPFLSLVVMVTLLHQNGGDLQRSWFLYSHLIIESSSNEQACSPPDDVAPQDILKAISDYPIGWLSLLAMFFGLVSTSRKQISLKNKVFEPPPLHLDHT